MKKFVGGWIQAILGKNKDLIKKSSRATVLELKQCLLGHTSWRKEMSEEKINSGYLGTWCIVTGKEMRTKWL